MTTKPLTLSTLLLLTMVSNVCYSDIAVIVNKELNVKLLTHAQVKDIFLDKTNVFPDQTETLPVMVPPDSPIYDEFVENVIKRRPTQLDAYWARLVFTGKGEPPKVLDSSEEVLEHVIEHKNAIGYVDLKDVNDEVKVVFTLE